MSDKIICTSYLHYSTEQYLYQSNTYFYNISERGFIEPGTLLWQGIKGIKYTIQYILIYSLMYKTFNQPTARQSPAGTARRSCPAVQCHCFENIVCGPVVILIRQ